MILDDLSAEERIGLVWPMSDPLKMEAAMCLWEAFLDLAGGPHATVLPFSGYLARHGSIVARHDLMELVEPVHVGWHLHCRRSRSSFPGSFDGDFAPWFLTHCTSLQPPPYDAAIGLVPDWLSRCRSSGPLVEMA
jgi:hypothetical protein